MRARLASALMGALALAALPGTAAAQAGAAKPAQPTKEQLEDAAYEMRVLISAMQSDKVEAPAKDALFQCLYNNSFAKISEAMAKVVADNAGKVNKRNADQMLVVMAGVCGYRPQQAAAKPGAAPAAKPAPVPARPATPAAKPGQGR